MTQKKGILCFFLLLPMLAIFAQDTVLKGQIFDVDGKEPLFGATVKIEDRGTTSDFDGNYLITLTPGTYDVEVSYVGYETMRQSITVSKGINQQDFTLGEAATILDVATVTSGKFEKPLGEVTVSLEVIKPTLLEDNNATSVDEVLGKVSGVDIIDGQANIRGGSGYSYGAGSRVLLLVDDIPILQADAGFPNWDDVPVENIEQIEVVKGAASALYGSSALNGIINVRTGYAKSDPVTKFSTFFTQTAGYEDESRNYWTESDTIATPRDIGFSALHKRKMGKFDLVLGGYYLDRLSIGRDNFSKYGRFNANTRYRFSDRLTAGINLNYNTGSSRSFFYWKGHEGADAQTAADGTVSESARTRYNIDPSLTYFAKNGIRHRLLGRFYWVNNENNNSQGNASQLYYGEYQVQKNWSEKGLVATAGLVSQGTAVVAELYGDTTYASNNYAAYLQLDKKFFDKLNVSGGVRYERNVLDAPELNILASGDTIVGGREVEGRPVFRLGANYQVAEYTFFRASWGQGYRYPTIAEKFITTDIGIAVVPNPQLQSETGWSTEIGIKQGVKIGNWGGFLDVSAFWSEYQNMMEFNLQYYPPITLVFQSQNVGDTRIRGIDTSIGGQGKIGDVELSVIGGYTYIDPRFLTWDQSGVDIQFINDVDQSNQGQYNAFASSFDENLLKYRFQHTFKMDIEARFKFFTIGGAYTYNSYMQAIDKVFSSFIDGLDEYRTATEGQGINVLDLRAGFEPLNNLKISLLAKNVLNEEYALRPGLLEAPRSFTIRLDYQF